MSLHRHRPLHRRDGYLPASGSVVESDPTPTASVLVQDTTATASPDATPVGFPLVATSVLDGLSTATTQSLSTPTASKSSSPSSGNQISLATVVGACAGAFVALLLAIALSVYCSKRHKQGSAYSKSRNAVNNVSRQRSHFEAWKRMDDNGDQQEHQERQERPARHSPPSGPLGSMFQRTITNTSEEKSSEGHEHNRESIGTMRHFAKYHPGLAAEMASQGTNAGANREVAKPPSALRLAGRDLGMAPPVSWDGETLDGNSYTSFYPGLSNSMSHQMVATAKSTPPATISYLHRWESAEVVHVNQADSDSLSEVKELRNPFSDSASSVKSSSKGQNPFFSARDHHSIRRPALPDARKDPFSDSNTPLASPPAIRSLIAALETPPPRLDRDDRTISMQSSVYSRTTTGDDDSAISVTAFPYPPAQINIH